MRKIDTRTVGRGRALALDYPTRQAVRARVKAFVDAGAARELFTTSSRRNSRFAGGPSSARCAADDFHTWAFARGDVLHYGWRQLPSRVLCRRALRAVRESFMAAECGRMRRFLIDQPVKFESTTSDHIFHGRVVARISDDYCMIEDRSGLPPRPVRTKRLEPDVEGAIFSGKVAA